MKVYLKFFKAIFFSLCILHLAACSRSPSNKQDGIIVLSMSSNGQYVIASTLRNKLELFNLKNHTKKTINHAANIYSAYFVKHTNSFIWQNDKNNQVTVETASGKIQQTFNPGFPTYGEVMTSNLKTYIASDVNFNLYIRRHNEVRWIHLDSVGFYGIGKLLNLKLSNNNKLLLTSGSDNSEFRTANAIQGANLKSKHFPQDSLILWNLNSLKPIYGFPGNLEKTYGTLDSINNYVVSGDEDTNLQAWNCKTGLLHKIYYDIWFGKYIKTGPKENDYKYDKTVLKAHPPKDFRQPVVGSTLDATISLNFVDKTHCLRFIYDIPYAILYSVNDPSPLKYLKLNTNPYPSINSYVRDESIDSSWQTHTVVVGHATDPGITVYNYNPTHQTLKVIWNTP